MCIEKTGRYKVDDPGVGWKIFDVDRDGNLTGYYFGNKPRPFSRWLKAHRFAEGDIPSLGWHIFQSEVEARKWRPHASLSRKPASHKYLLSRVKYRKVRRKGYLYGGQRTFTADEILILPEKKEKK